MLPSTLYDSTPEQLKAVPASPTSTLEVEEASGSRLRLRAAEADELTLGEWDCAVDLLRTAFNGGPNWFSATEVPRDHLLWKLADYPGPTRIYFSEGDRGADAPLLGFLGTFSRDWLVRGQHRRGTDMVDAALHPDIQGRVLLETFRSLRREIPRWGDPDFCFSFASHPALIRNRGFQGKHDLGRPLDTFVRPLDLLRFVRGERVHRPAHGSSRTRIQIELERRRSTKPALARLVAWQGRILRQRIRRRPLDLDGVAGPTSFDVRTYERFDERIRPFFAEAAEAFDFIQVRTPEFLNWRYVDPRSGQFTIRVAEVDGDVLGYAVLETGRATANLADLLVRPGRADIAHALVRDASILARESGASAIRSWMMRDHPYEALLTDLGFVRVHTSTKPVFHASPRTDPEELAFLQHPDTRVHLMLGDSDHV